MNVSTSLIAPPPTAAQRQAELRDVHALTDHRTPAQDARAQKLDAHGAWGVWQDAAAQYRQHVGFVRGWIGTLRMDAAIGTAVTVDQTVKRRFKEPRPFQLDTTITPLGKIPSDTSYPSGHSAASAAAATVLASLWPEQRAQYEQLAADVRWARVYSGVHFPSDTMAGAQVGRTIGERFAASSHIATS